MNNILKRMGIGLLVLVVLDILIGCLMAIGYVCVVHPKWGIPALGSVAICYGVGKRVEDWSRR